MTQAEINAEIDAPPAYKNLIALDNYYEAVAAAENILPEDIASKAKLKA